MKSWHRSYRTLRSGNPSTADAGSRESPGAEIASADITTDIKYFCSTIKAENVIP